MLSLFEMMANAQNGAGMEALARQFGLSAEQTQTALSALLPAFSQGLKRNTQDPFGVAAFMNAMASGEHGRAFDEAAHAFSPAGVAEGNAVLGQLFGSKDLSRAVAQQAAQMTGIGQDVLAKMLPVIAAMLMGGLAKQSTGQMGREPQAGSGNIFGDIIGQMMRQGMPGAAPGAGAPPPRPQAPLDPFDNPFGKALQDMFGGAGGQQAGGTDGNPFGRIFEEMMGGGRAAEPDPAPETNPSGRPRNPYDDLFGGMFEAGSNARDEYQKSMESVFDRFLKGMDR